MGKAIVLIARVPIDDVDPPFRSMRLPTKGVKQQAR